MISFLITIFAKFWPVILGGSGIAASAIFWLFKTRSTNTTVAQANEQVAQAQASVANAQAADAEINAAAAQAGEQAAVNATQAAQTVQATPDSEVNAQLAAMGDLRKD